MKLSEIQKIIKDFEESTLTELELELNEVKLKLSKNTIEKNTNTEAVVNKPSNDEKAIVEDLVGLDQIRSPLVGTFYEASNPTSKPFVTIGQKINNGDVVCIIEAMKIMNEITSPVSGVIETISFKNGDVVGFDDLLFTVKQHEYN